MKPILIINTGGTFNKIYNPLTGDLDIDTKGNALKTIAHKWLTNFEVINIINKDSLEMDAADRLRIFQTIQEASHVQAIIVVHGTDTMDQTAAYLQEHKINKTIVLTGAMVPFSIDPIEATANLSSAYGFLQGLSNDGVYIAMHGKVELYPILKKNRERGYFEIERA